MPLDSMRRDEEGRPILDYALIDVTRELVRANPERLGHVIPPQILFIAGAARLESRASIRPFDPGPSGDRPVPRPKVILSGVRVLYEICLRPRFFLRATAEERLFVIAHELWHIAPAFDGTLADDRRHAARGTPAIEAEVEEIVKAWSSARSERSAFFALAHSGEARLRAWLARPPSRVPLGSQLRAFYGEDDLFSSIVLQA